jgi:hypothetical protein
MVFLLDQQQVLEWQGQLRQFLQEQKQVSV